MKKKRLPEAQRRSLADFPQREPGDYTATARIIDRMKSPEEYRHGSRKFTNISASRSVRYPDNGTVSGSETHKPIVGDA